MAASTPKLTVCNGCLFSDNHDSCVPDFINNVNARVKSKSVKKTLKRNVWKPTGKVFTNIGYIWRPTGRTFTIVGNVCPLTRITTTAEVPLRKPIALDSNTPKPMVIQIVLWYLDFGCSKHMTGDRSQLTNFVDKFLGTFFDSDLEVAFRQHTCFICNLEGVDLLTGSRGNNLYTLSLGDMMASSLVCLFSKASMTKSWLWHRRLSHLNFGTINHLARQGLVRGLPKLKFEKDHLCSACAMRKSKKKSYKPKSVHMDLCGPMHVESVKKNSIFWAEAAATACYTQNRSIVCIHHGKTPYDLLHEKLHDLSFLHVFGALCYPTNDSENLGKLQLKADIGPALHEITPATISSRIVPNPTYSTLFVPPSRIDWDMLFQPFFDELLTPPPSVDHPAPEVIASIAKAVAPEPAASTGSPSSTTVGQDAPSPSNS
uniref:GAG-pre-integrase domain-containing protein n=1 Tax=Tanacetum cinerariifolium TaxID=118510 RepID=A0A6L2KRX8_TANCI|nr:hypothetical protein [Tanacetum cinerariifolium]